MINFLAQSSFNEFDIWLKVIRINFSQMITLSNYWSIRTEKKVLLCNPLGIFFFISKFKNYFQKDLDTEIWRLKNCLSYDKCLEVLFITKISQLFKSHFGKNFSFFESSLINSSKKL